MFRLIIVLFIFPISSFGIHYSIDNSPYYIDDTIIITEEQSISIDPGVTFYLAPEVEIIIYGQTNIKGNSTNLISFLPQEPTIGWDKIKLINNTHYIDYIFIQDGVLWSEYSAIYLSNIHINNTQDLPNNHPFVLSVSGYTNVSDCLLEGVNKGEGILIYDQENTIIKDTKVEHVPDAIEITRTDFAVITNNTLLDMDDDAIDLNNCHYITISNNDIQGAADRGIEIGSQSFGSSTDILLENNLIINCLEGINVREGSECVVRNTTFFHNDIAAVAIEEIPNTGGSSLIIENSIFSESNSSDLFSDHLSSIVVNYSLSDKQLIAGNENIYADPLFYNSAITDLSLSINSPAIDAGNPLYLLDEDCTLSDIGAIFFDQCNETCPCDSKVIIYPNPFTTTLIFRLNNISSNTVKINLYNIFGKLIDHAFFDFDNEDENQLNWRNLNLSQGYYFIEFIDGEQVFIKKVLCIN